MNTTGRQFSSSSAPEAQPSEAGFTLVEVSVAVAVGVPVSYTHLTLPTILLV